MTNASPSVFLEWIPQAVYIQNYLEKKETIDERIKKHHWIKGIHYNVPKGSKTRWINIMEVNKWAAGQVIQAYQVAS
ncbi:hypothetical protein [Pseudoalteromonas sp. R3]|uniref:hypothetical protein n=1 Tax=Pseudoalteromonas sp. R3 TaxID=1709477 RepID=UPI0006B5C659|nr:hypothetical protein [Pseudoalteromonas sp. R3]AZZ98791.1 excisionase [Pseudoalteromonas sp. R3]